MAKPGDFRTPKAGAPITRIAPPWLRVVADGVQLSVYVQPGARHTAVAGVHGDALKIQVHAPAQDDRANEALLDYLAQRCGVPRRDVALMSGARSRMKRVLFSSLAPADAEQRLAPANQSGSAR